MQMRFASALAFSSRAKILAGLVTLLLPLVVLAGSSKVLVQPNDNNSATKLIHQQWLAEPLKRPSENYWTSTGGPPGADVLSMVTGSSYLFAGTLGGGAFRSGDGGETWVTK